MQNTLADATTHLQLYPAKQLDYCIGIQFVPKFIREFKTPTILSHILFLLMEYGI